MRANDRACNYVRRRLKMCLEFFGTSFTTSTVSVLGVMMYRKICSVGGGCSGVRGIEPILRVPLLLLLPLPLPCSLLSSNYYMLLQRIHNQLERRSCAFDMCKGRCAAFQENIDCRTMSRRTGTSAHGRCGETSAKALREDESFVQDMVFLIHR